MRRTPLLALVVAAACARPPQAITPAQPGLFGPSSQPVLLPPRFGEPGLPRNDAGWRAVGREAAALLSQYVAINTTNPPGNELKTAEWLKAVLAREGITAQLFEPRPGKANLYARLAGDGSARPLILLNHMDVVLASPEYWKVDPFAGTMQDGYLWGRGALDMKGEAITQLMTLLTLKRAGVALKRDVIFLATADEEVGAGVGAAWLVEHHPDLVQDAEFLLTEGGTIRAGASGRIEYYGIGTTEKSPMWLEVTAHGTAGHGSRPTPDNPVHRLVRALYRIAAYQTPLVVTPVVERYLRDLSTIEPDPLKRAWLADARAAIRDSTAVRALTGDLGDTAVAITPLGPTWPATESPTDTELFRSIVAAARERTPNALVTTPPLTGFTDSHYFRQLGIVSYGLSPFPLNQTESRGVHGNDERVSLDGIAFGVRFVYDVVSRVVAK